MHGIHGLCNTYIVDIISAAAAHLNNPEQCAHRLQVIVGGIACEQLNDEAAHRPDVRGRSHLCHLDHLHEQQQIALSLMTVCTGMTSPLLPCRRNCHQQLP